MHLFIYLTPPFLIIGLTVARSLSRRLGGDIQLDTTYTDGARFVMTLPIPA